MSDGLAIFAEGLLASHSGKTGHGVIRYGTREVVAVVDSTHAGRRQKGSTSSAVRPAWVESTTATTSRVP